MLKILFFNPLYNALMWLVAHMPEGSIVLAVIILTIVVKLILAPLSLQALKSQIIQKQLQPELARVKKEFKDPKEQSQKMMELYKKYKTNPFSGCVVLLIQIPIIFALYYVFLRGLTINPEILYPFVQAPDHIGVMFFDIDMSQKHIIFAILAAGAQFLQLWFSPTRLLQKKDKEKEKTALQTEGENGESKNKMEGLAQQFGSNFQKQMIFMMPLMIFMVGMAVPAAVAVYWIISNLFTFVQELFFRPRLAEIRATYYSEV
jgi:YidC/Oxa1 family membrane protein insertase